MHLFCTQNILFQKYLSTHRTIMETEIRHCICMINFSVCQTLNITQGEEVLLLLYFYSVLGFYSTPNITENVNCKLQNSSRMNHCREVHNILPKNFMKEMLEPHQLFTVSVDHFYCLLMNTFIQTENILEKATMRQSLWVIINSKSEEKPHNYLMISLWARETLKKL